MGDLEYSLIEAVSVSQVFVLEIADNVYRNIVVDISNLFRAVDESDLYFSSREGIMPPKPIGKSLWRQIHKIYRNIKL